MKIPTLITLIYAITVILGMPFLNTYLNANQWGGLQTYGWRAEVREKLDEIIKAKAGCRLPVVFDLDETILARDIADATLAVLVRDGNLTKDQVPAFLIPPFRLGNRTVSVDDACDLIEYGQWIQQSTLHQTNDLSSNMYFYCWSAQILAGLKCDAVVDATLKAYQENLAIKDLGKYGEETKIWSISGQSSCLMPFVRPEMADLLGAFLQNDYDVWIISASPVHIARAIVLEGVNKVIAAQGISQQIAPDHIIGISTMLQDDEGNFHKDCPLVCNDEDYANLNREVLGRYLLTAQLTPPVTGYSGKVAAIVERIGTFPYFGAGDSLSDIPFMKLSTHKLWMARLESPLLQKNAAAHMGDDISDSWMIQPVLSKKAPCLVANEAQLSSLLLKNEELRTAKSSMEVFHLANQADAN
ncbi:MAG TPA: hypothetical protein VGP47_01585 [Parachlamydiaceae bacterium]|nr:hypothetical protein [Parachlamydiaceae bacterium]